jgi:hypothetical protein
MKIMVGSISWHTVYCDKFRDVEFRHHIPTRLSVKEMIGVTANKPILLLAHCIQSSPK